MPQADAGPQTGRELRGLVILLMVFYHAAYDLVYIFGVNWPFFSSPLMHWLQLKSAKPAGPRDKAAAGVELLREMPVDDCAGGFGIVEPPLMHWLQLFIATSFITVSGICCRFSRNNLKRGLLTFGLGMVLTVVTSLLGIQRGTATRIRKGHRGAGRAGEESRWRDRGHTE